MAGMMARLRGARDGLAGWAAAENAAAAGFWTAPDRVRDRRLAGLVVVAAFALFCQHYLVINGGGNLPLLLWRLGMEDAARALHAYFADPEAGRFRLLLYWAGGVIICLFVMPALYLKATGASLKEHGLQWGRGHARIYALLFLLMLPPVLGAAMTPEFSAYYPFFRPAEGESLWPRFFVWEAVYLVQFLAVEFFFRGALVHAARHRFGVWSILLPLIPYMMIHFGKPAGEAAGAVVAGLVLGYLSLRTGSILYGVLLHAGVAITMDLTALAITGRLF